MAEIIDTKEHGALDWRLREISASIDNVAKAIDRHASAVEGLRLAVTEALGSTGETPGEDLAAAIARQPKLGRGIG